MDDFDFDFLSVEGVEVEPPQTQVARADSALGEAIEAQHTVEALTEAFKGAKVVCNTVGPFVKFGLTAVEAALKAGCHHLDTTGEQAYIRDVRDQFGELYAQAGLVVVGGARRRRLDLDRRLGVGE